MRALVTGASECWTCLIPAHRCVRAGFNVETVEYKNISFTVWDVGGQDKVRVRCQLSSLTRQAAQQAL